MSSATSRQHRGRTGAFFFFFTKFKLKVSLFCLDLKIGFIAPGSWPVTWSRTTSLLRPATSLLSCVVLRRWSSTPVCQIWTSWDTKQKTFLHTSALIYYKTGVFPLIIQPLNQQSLYERCWWSTAIYRVCFTVKLVSFLMSVTVTLIWTFLEAQVYPYILYIIVLLCLYKTTAVLNLFLSL